MRHGLHPKVKDRLALIEKIVIETQEPGVRIIDKTGPLANPADRDHCIQYMVAVPLIFGRLTAADYDDSVASDPRIDVLRAKMQVRETRSSPGNTTSATSAISATRCTSCSAMARRPSRSEAISPSATASDAPRECRCWFRSSKLRWRRIFRQNRPTPSGRCLRAEIWNLCR